MRVIKIDLPASMSPVDPEISLVSDEVREQLFRELAEVDNEMSETVRQRALSYFPEAYSVFVRTLLLPDRVGVSTELWIVDPTVRWPAGLLTRSAWRLFVPIFTHVVKDALSSRMPGVKFHMREQEAKVTGLAPTRADGKEWDSGGTAPDVYYEIHWQGHRVFESSTKEDTFVARWSTASIGPRDVLKAVSIDDSIKAARITARPGEKIGFRVYDDDLTGDDLVASWEVAVESLQVGDHKWDRPAGQLLSVVCRVLPFDAVALEALTK